MLKPYHDQTNLALEIETAPSGLPNLVLNPSGEKGAWFWSTPVANTAMSVTGIGPSLALKFLTANPQACYFVSDYMPVAASKYVSFRVDITQLTSSHNIKVTYEWYNAAKALLSTSAQSGALATIGTNYGPTAQAPANTAYVRLRADFYNGTGNPNGNGSVTFNKAMVTWQNTGTVTTSRVNLLSNPSVETNTGNWSLAGGTLARVTTPAASVGTYCLEATNTGDPANFSLGTSVGVTGGKTYTHSVAVRASSASNIPVFIHVNWYDAGGAYINTSYASSSNGTALTTGWTRVSRSITAPSNATSAIVWLSLDRFAGAGTKLCVDAALFEEGSSAGTYFDGDTAAGGGVTYAWTGTAHASTSTATQAGTIFPYAEPYTWRNILGPTFSMSIKRAALNVGTLEAKINDALLDPAETTDVRPGRLVRLRALVGGAWTSVYEGKLTTAHVDYVRNKRPGAIDRTIVTIAAVDNIATLANRGETSSVATIPALPYLLEGKGVPWNVNGSGSQITTVPTVVAENADASTLDQVAITRDTALGYAWVDRANTLQVWDAASLGTTVAATFSDAAGSALSYSDINADFDTDRCINEVHIKWLRYDPSTGETIEVDYGPYVDQTSIDTWGPFSATFTICGATESPSAIASYASQILTANAVPVRRANLIKAAVTDATTLAALATLDLYSLVHVTYGTKVNADYRITALEHAITATKWVTTYSFDVIGSVASPQVVPSPPVVEPPYDPTRFVAGQAAIVGAAPPAGKLKIIKEGTAVTTVANTAGGFSFSYVGGAFPNGVVTCVVMPGDNTGNFGQIVTVSGNMTLGGFNGVAVQRSGAVVANGTAIRVNYIAIGW